MWLYALVDILYRKPMMTAPVFRTGLILFAVTLIQTLAAAFAVEHKLVPPQKRDA
jgi:hypothetical protein